MKRILVTSSGIQITLESIPGNNSDNFENIAKALTEHFQCLQVKPEYDHEDILFNTGLIISKVSDRDDIALIFNKDLLN
ncbi:hypothetical protein [Aquimarina sp. 2201CG5-10]|uniref:hypothetical protein n=1 Tax=Aquimarina callyspongiae TaxID=3098150 RepID=UPI002AB4920A|nr:hypothetical protein [Aquimarina sp. 2201CG5-10]MDY8137573.1 hypothetical protein [Aquimarina sp. 2201CG5-10]